MNAYLGIGPLGSKPHRQRSDHVVLPSPTRFRSLRSDVSVRVPRRGGIATRLRGQGPEERRSDRQSVQRDRPDRPGPGSVGN